jgi:16S rRNA (cytosine1402-N4)-methyltransferase
MGDGISAAELIENISVEKLTEILRDYGDVSKAKIIAHAIKEKLPKTTFQLRDLIYNPNDVAPVFQAIRIAVNDELGEIERALAAVPNLLGPGGICACVTFHSLEDRLVKNTFRAWTTPAGDPRMPVVAAAPFELLKAVKPSKSELELNPRARSAHLRAVRKL